MNGTDSKFFPYIYVGADDYGMNPLSSDRIVECTVAAHGLVNKISVMPNAKLSESELKERLAALWDKGVNEVVHLNLVEGVCVSDKSELSLLVDRDGHFRHSFFGLFVMSLSPQRRRFAEQVKRELRAQIRRSRAIMPAKSPLMLDSHQHTHMIPAVFRVLCEIIQEEKLEVAYMRNSAEPSLPFWKTPSVWLDCISVNLIKHIVIKACNVINHPLWHRLNLPSAYFLGIMFSGNMSVERVNRILPAYLELARRKQKNVELLFHPGYIERNEELFDKKKISFRRFYYSKGRRTEYHALRNVNRQEIRMT